MDSESQHEAPEVFWAEIAPCEHLVQIYTNDRIFIDALQNFVAAGLGAGEGVVVLATPAHLAALEHQLISRGIDVGGPAYANRFIALNAAEMLARFMVDDLPDEGLFETFVDELLARAGRTADGARRRVRAFGELVALLWANGYSAATVRLEHLWHRFCHEKDFCLFCAYPQIGFTQDVQSSIQEICATHSKVVPG